MAGNPLIWSAVAQAAWVVPVALVAAMVAQAVGQPRIVGAMLAGLLLGPAVLGQAAPDWHQWLVVGGHAELRDMRRFEKEVNENMVGLMHRGYSARALKNMQTHAESGIAQRQRAYDRAVATRSGGRSVLMYGAALGLVLAGGLLVAGPRPAPLTADAGAIAAGAAVTVVLFSVAAVTLLGHWVTARQAAVGGWSLVAIALAAGLPIHASHAPAAAGDEHPALHAATVRWLLLGAWSATAALLAVYERPVHALGVVAFAVCVPAIGLPTTRLFERKIGDPVVRDALSVVWVVALGAVAAGASGVHPLAAVAIAALACPFVAGADAPFTRRLVEFAAPVVALLATLHADPARHFGLWLWVVALIVIGDGKALGAWVAARLLARRGGLASLHLGAAASAGGAALLAIAWLLYHRQVIGAPLYTAVVLAELVIMVLYRPMMAMAATLRQDAPPTTG